MTDALLALSMSRYGQHGMEIICSVHDPHHSEAIWFLPFINNNYYCDSSVSCY